MHVENKLKVCFKINFVPPDVCRYEDTDLVVVVTMRPSSTAGVAGYAIAYQRDTERRATVGLFNWCPHTVDETLYKIETEEEKLPVSVLHESIVTTTSNSTSSSR